MSARPICLVQQEGEWLLHRLRVLREDIQSDVPCSKACKKISSIHRDDTMIRDLLLYYTTASAAADFFAFTNAERRYPQQERTASTLP